MKVYHYIIANEAAERFGDISTRKEYIPDHRTKLPDGWIKIAVCGYHEAKPKHKK